MNGKVIEIEGQADTARIDDRHPAAATRRLAQGHGQHGGLVQGIAPTTSTSSASASSARETARSGVRRPTAVRMFSI